MRANNRILLSFGNSKCNFNVKSVFGNFDMKKRERFQRDNVRKIVNSVKQRWTQFGYILRHSNHIWSITILGIQNEIKTKQTRIA